MRFYPRPFSSECLTSARISLVLRLWFPGTITKNILVLEVKGSEARFLQKHSFQLNLENQLSKAGVIVAFICPACSERLCWIFKMNDSHASKYLHLCGKD